MTKLSSVLIAAVALILPTASFALTASDFVTITGQSGSNKFGHSLASGDFNGDGYQDLATGAYQGTTPYLAVTYGSSTTLSSFTVTTSNTAVITGNGTNTDGFGNAVAAGDINNDGYGDLIVTAPNNNIANELTPAGAVYLIPGRAAQLTSGGVESDSSNVRFTGDSGAALGAQVAAGDVNGDGYDDFVVSTNIAHSGVGNGAGATFLVLGKSSAFTNAVLSTTSTSQFTGEAAGDNAGTTVAVGDVNGDGYAEIAMGSPGNDAMGSGAGAIYVRYGSSTTTTGVISTSTLVEFTGEAAGDNAGGTALTISTGSVNDDTYNDLIIGAKANDDGASEAGAVYVVPGSATEYSGVNSLSVSSILEFTGVTAADNVPSSLAAADVNQDGFADIFIGAKGVSSSTGAIYVVTGSSTLASASLATAISIAGTNASDNFGKAAAVGSLNGDDFPELLVGANGYPAGANTGAAMIGYLYIDADLDGIAGTTGINGTNDTAIVYDCNDTDATVSADQTYYVDSDGDALGDPAVTTATCSATAPVGYVTNDDDTNDTIPNNGVEIGGDGVDNDGDGSTDELNTIDENGAHPYYSTLTASDNAAAAITTIVGSAAGQIAVTYADNSVYTFSVFTSSSTQDTNIAQYNTTGYGVVLHNKGKKLYLVNLYTGETSDKVTLKKKGFFAEAMVLQDLRNDDKTEVIVTAQTKANNQLFIIKVKATAGTLAKADNAEYKNKNVKVTKTKVKKKTIQLRSSKNKALATYTVTAKYNLKLN